MKISISVQNQNLSYFAGQTIYGSVVVDTTRETTTSGLKIKCIGLGKVKWTQRQGKATVYRGDEHAYIDCKAYLIGSQGGPDVTVPAGVHQYPFVFQLPRNIPSSFYSKYGRIEYYLQATFKRSWKFDAETRLNFTINAIVDLNTIQIPNVGSVATPLRLVNKKSYEFCCYQSRPITFKLTVNQGGFVSGQNVKFSLEILNLSNRNVKKCFVTFYKGEKYKAGVYTKELKDILMKFKYPGVPKGGEQSWPEREYKLPSLAPTGLGGCHLIELTYWIDVRVKVSCRSSLKGELPIMIGNIPLRTYFNPVPAIPVPQSMPQPVAQEMQLEYHMELNPAMGTETGPLDEYPDLPPPTYEEVAGACPTYEQVQLEELETESRIYLQNRSFMPTYPNYHSWN